jgi:hypothetical protein
MPQCEKDNTMNNRTIFVPFCSILLDKIIYAGANYNKSTDKFEFLFRCSSCNSEHLEVELNTKNTFYFPEGWSYEKSNNNYGNYIFYCKKCNNVKKIIQ